MKRTLIRIVAASLALGSSSCQQPDRNAYTEPAPEVKERNSITIEQLRRVEQQYRYHQPPKKDYEERE